MNVLPITQVVQIFFDTQCYVYNYNGYNKDVS